MCEVNICASMAEIEPLWQKSSVQESESGNEQGELWWDVFMDVFRDATILY